MPTYELEGLGVKCNAREKAERLEELFDELDTNENGYVDSGGFERMRKKLSLQASTAKNPERKRILQDLTILEQAQVRLPNISGLNNDEWGFENGGMTRKDLQKLIVKLKGSEFGITIATRAAELHSQWDADKNGYVNKKEALMANCSRSRLVTRTRKRFVSRQLMIDTVTTFILYKRLEGFSNMHNDEFGPENDGVTKKDIANLKAVFSAINNYFEDASTPYMPDLLETRQDSDPQKGKTALDASEKLHEIVHSGTLGISEM